MPTIFSEHLILSNPDGCPDLEFYINDNNEIFVQEYDTVGGFWFPISFADWQKIKCFIDEQFKNVK